MFLVKNVSCDSLVKVLTVRRFVFPIERYQVHKKWRYFISLVRLYPQFWLGVPVQRGEFGILLGQILFNIFPMSQDINTYLCFYVTVGTSGILLNLLEGRVAGAAHF